MERSEVELLPRVISKMIEVGYEQTSCNDEMLVDFGDAVRIFSERYDSPPEEVQCVLINYETVEKSFNDNFAGEQAAIKRRQSGREEWKI